MKEKKINKEQQEIKELNNDELHEISGGGGRQFIKPASPGNSDDKSPKDTKIKF